jgi:N6-L-threonylcarbamoyladenine synthase
MILGSTRDDAAGEAFDKGASMLGLPYPGGPSLEKLAKGGDPDAFAFPLPFHADPHCDFSFSGLKTALKYLIARLGGLEKIPAEQRASIAASYQHAIGQHLIDKLQRAMKDHRDVREIHMVGGVAANRSITKQCDIIARTYGLIFRAPAALAYCTDNGAMIAAAGTFLAEEESLLLTQPFETSATASLASALEAH